MYYWHIPTCVLTTCTCVQTTCTCTYCDLCGFAHTHNQSRTHKPVHPRRHKPVHPLY